MTRIYFIMLASLLLLACKSKENSVKSSATAATQQVLIYKTIADFTYNVPITMNAARTEILSYPAPSDLFYIGKLAIPTLLKNGYLLDNRGINENVVFLKYTYKYYSQLKEAPSLQEMMQNILEKYPLQELIYCGQRVSSSNEIKTYNTLIDKNFEGCKKAEITSLKVIME